MEILLYMDDKSTIQKKKLKHVKVYDKLYEQIQNGIYPVDSQLPSEIALSEQMGVSRMTLRKALALFVEDGIIKNVPGVGHFVCSPQKNKNSFLDKSKILHPIQAYCTEKTDTTEFAFRIEPPTHSIMDTLEQYTAAVVIADRWYKNKDVPFAYSLSFIPIEYIADKHINLNNSKELLNFLETGCYENMHSCRRICSHSTTGNFTAKVYTLSHNDSFMLIQENIYDENERIIVSNKHYIPSEMYKIEIVIK